MQEGFCCHHTETTAIISQYLPLEVCSSLILELNTDHIAALIYYTQTV